MRILLVEDSKRLQESIAKGLRRSGFAVDVVDDGKQGLIYGQTSDYDVIVLDLMLPVLDGLSVLTQLRAKGISTHILILTAMDLISDRVKGLQLGADDYLVKPFAFEELLARVQAMVRRQHSAKSPLITIGDLEIDLTGRRVSCDGRDILLTAREFALVEYLACHRGKLVTRAELEEHLYDDRKQVMSNAIDSAICTVRSKLQAAGCASIIHTRRGMGYVMDQSGPAAMVKS